MFCYNCGHQLDGASRYCPNCGAVQNIIQQIKPVVTKVNVDDTLPRNGNFFITMLVLIFIVLSCCIFLTSYKAKYDYKISFVHDGFKVYLPYGFGHEIEEENNEKRLVISDEEFKFALYSGTDDYDSYKYNDFKKLKEVFSSKGINPIDIKEITRDGHSIIIAKYKDESNEDTETYMYIYDTGKSDLIFCGNAITSKDFEEDCLDTLIKILSKIERA